MKRISNLFFPSDLKRGHNTSLDGVRGLAVLLVAFSHLSANGINLALYLDFSGIGKVGVYIFFVLSSYLLDRQIATALYNDQENYSYWANYLVRRFMRIYPLYILLLLIYWWIYKNGYIYCVCIPDLKDLSQHLFLEKGRGVFWSIAVEFKYYLVSPLILLFCKYILKWNLISITLLCLVTIITISFLEYSNPFERSNRIDLYYYLPVFLIGSYIALIEVKYRDKYSNRLKKIQKSLDHIGIACLIVLLVFGAMYFYRIFFTTGLYFTFFRQLPALPAFLIGLLLISALYGKGLISKITSTKFLRFLGAISFSFYLIHYPVIKFISEQKFLYFDQQFKFLLVFGISILISSVTYLLIERPAQQLFRRK